MHTEYVFLTMHCFKRYSMGLLLFLLPLGMQGRPIKQKDLRLLSEWLQGTFTNQKQAMKDTSLLDGQWVMQRIWPDAEDGYWFYWELARRIKPEKPLQQRVGHLYQNAQKETIWETYLLLDEAKYVNAWKNNELLNTITHDRLKGNSACLRMVKKNKKNFTLLPASESCMEENGTWPAAQQWEIGKEYWLYLEQVSDTPVLHQGTQRKPALRWVKTKKG